MNKHVSTQVRASKALTFSASDGPITGYNFVQQRAFECEHDIFSLLKQFADWKEVKSDKNGVIAQLIDYGILIEKDSETAAIELDLDQNWEWGTPLAMYHNSILNREYEPLEFNIALQKEKSCEKKSPELFFGNEDYAERIILPAAADSPLFDVMKRRRTNRSKPSIPTSLQALSEILQSSMAITGFVDGVVGKLPLKMTPSGGARNPFEAYIFAREITDLSDGIYHYSAVDHSIGLIKRGTNLPMGELAGGQEWIDDMNCLIVLCAFFERSMWKYEDPNAYRVMLIEAGHIAQNMMLTGTAHELSICPTGALSHNAILDALNLPKGPMISPIYALAVGSLD